MPEVTCDYMVPLTVRVNTDTGEVTEVWLHLDSFQSGPRGWFQGRNGECTTRASFRQAYIDTDEESGEFVDGESELGDKALAIADRVRLGNPEFQVNFVLDKE